LTFRCKDASPIYISLTVNLCFAPPNHLTKFGHGVFPHLYIKIQAVPHSKRSQCYKTHSVNVILVNNRCFFRHPYKSHTTILWAYCGILI